ncbi:MAG TPA: dipeptidase PepE [Cyclobacteriaceae bacterium]|nr:dipeptidase PepE [Cyclobacteriaceae bacterium]
MSRLLLLSNSTMPGAQFFSWPGKFVREFLGGEKTQVLFVPYAAVTLSHDEYAGNVERAFEKLGYSLLSLHTVKDQQQAVNSASVIVIGGGNSFVLLNRLYTHDLVKLIRNKVLWGTPYIGWSAGANMACPTLMTTNDMPIVYPPSFDALNLVPFQINPHYSEFTQPGHGGETRQQRIEEFLAMNTRKVVGLPEGMLLHREEQKLTLKGNGIARLFQNGGQLMELESGQDVSFLLSAEN